MAGRPKARGRDARKQVGMGGREEDHMKLARETRSPLAIKAALHGQAGTLSPAAVKEALLELEQACRGIGLARAAGGTPSRV